MFALKVHQEQLQTTRGAGKNPFSFPSRRCTPIDAFKACGFAVPRSNIHLKCILILLLKTLERISKGKFLTDKRIELLPSVCNYKNSNTNLIVYPNAKAGIQFPRFPAIG